MSHIVDITPERALVDRQTLARLTGRSVHTIRLRCPVAEYRNRRALYDVGACEQILKQIPTRRAA